MLTLEPAAFRRAATGAGTETFGGAPFAPGVTVTLLLTVKPFPVPTKGTAMVV
jgi:hypothetical protein